MSNRCKICGGMLEIDHSAREVECPYCGNLMEFDESRTHFFQLYSRADHAWSCKDFDEALALYEQIVAEDSLQAEAHFSIALCRYGISYELDPVTMKQMPTCNRINRASVLDDKNFLAAMKTAPASQREKYRARAEEIDRISKEFLKIVDKESPYEVFISYKRTDAEGRRTIDSQIAKRLYLFLKEKGIKVFFAEETLKEIGGEKYEPYIFAALTSAPVMILMGSQKEYFEAVWVKNEWRRFLALMAEDPKKVLIPVYLNCDPYKAIPQELLSVQAFDALSPVFNEEIADLVKKKLGESQNTVKQGKGLAERYATPEKVEQLVSALDCEPELAADTLVWMKGDFEKAKNYIVESPEYKKAVWTCAECGTQNTHDICHNPECGLTKKESREVALRREQLAREEERRSQRYQEERARRRRSFFKKLCVCLVLLLVLGGVGWYFVPDFLPAETNYSPEILKTYCTVDENSRENYILTFKEHDETGSVSGTFEKIADGYTAYSFTGKVVSKKLSGKVVAELTLEDGTVMNVTVDRKHEKAGIACEVEGYPDKLSLTAGPSRYDVNTADELKAMANSDGLFILKSDIDLSGVNWAPIEGFKGIFIGGDHTIKNLTIEKESSSVGFFAHLEGTVLNLKFENASIKVPGNVASQSENVGILCGQLSGSISNISVSGTVDAEYAKNVGGIAGFVGVLPTEGLMKDLASTADVKGASYVGGIFGKLEIRCFPPQA